MPDFNLPRLSPQDALATRDALIDVRKAAARAESGVAIPGARWIDPFALSPRHPVLDGDGRLVFFCVHGQAVSHYATALALLTGRDAAYVVGGFEALVAAGATTVPLAGDAA